MFTGDYLQTCKFILLRENYSLLGLIGVDKNVDKSGEDSKKIYKLHLA